MPYAAAHGAPRPDQAAGRADRLSGPLRVEERAGCQRRGSPRAGAGIITSWRAITPPPPPAAPASPLSASSPPYGRQRRGTTELPRRGRTAGEERDATGGQDRRAHR